MSKKLAEIFNIPEKPSGETGKAVSAVTQVFEGGDTLAQTDAGVIEVTVDVKKAEQLNRFVQTELASVYELASDAAREMVLAIKHGDVDARSIDGTAKLLEAATKALTEMNNYNMFVQKHLVERGIRAEMEKLHEQVNEGRKRFTREELLALAAESKDDSKDDKDNETKPE